MISREMKTTLKWAVAACILTAAILWAPQGMAQLQLKVLKATPDFYDFGTIKEGDPAEITVTVENIGEKPIEITNVQTS
jgi:uncharacterized membrane protein